MTPWVQTPACRLPGKNSLKSPLRRLSLQFKRNFSTRLSYSNARRNISLNSKLVLYHVHCSSIISFFRTLNHSPVRLVLPQAKQSTRESDGSIVFWNGFSFNLFLLNFSGITITSHRHHQYLSCFIILSLSPRSLKRVSYYFYNVASDTLLNTVLINFWLLKQSLNS